MKKILVLQDMPLFPYRIYCYNELADRGYDLTVVSVSNNEMNYEIPLKFDHIRKGYKQYGAFIWLKDFTTNICNSFDYIIVTPNLRVLNFSPLYGEKYRDKILAWGHMKGCTSANPIAAWVRRPLLRNMNALIFYESGTRDEFLLKGFPKEMLFVANNTQYVEQNFVILGKTKEYFLYVGRIQERKGVDIALKAFAKLKYKVQDEKLKFVIVGGGDKESLQKVIQEEDIADFVEFTGAMHNQKKLAEIFSKAYAYVSPGHVGLGVLHSLACGVPVITCTGRLHSVEITNCRPDNSLLIPYTVDDIADAMNKLYSDKNLQKKMSENAYEYYQENCTIDKMVDGIDNAIKYVQKNNGLKL